jgi:hypothetical protein
MYLVRGWVCPHLYETCHEAGYFFFFFAGAGGGERGRKRYWGLNSGPHTVNPVCVTKPFGIHVKSKHPFSKHRFKSIK